MNRPVHVWISFGACLAVVLAAMAWISFTALRLDDAQEEARLRADREERVRLALWRMESAMAPILARENTRPYFTYQAIYPEERAYTKMYANLGPGDILVPSPLLTDSSPNILLHFQFDPAGHLSSPQVPGGDMREIAERGYLSPAQIDASARELERFRSRVDLERIEAKLEAGSAAAATFPGRLAAARGDGSPPQPSQEDVSARSRSVQTLEEMDETLQEDIAGQGVSQELRNQLEWNARWQVRGEATAPPPSGRNFAKGVTATEVVEGGMVPIWIDSELLLARTVQVGKARYIQGCWMNWDVLGRWLVEGIVDLLPDAKLVPVAESEGAAERRLAAIPARLDPGRIPSNLPPRTSPVRFSLILAWICVVLAAAAVAALLLGTISLSERRATFASAVTHELRTPLTTFRMYTELLADGMVREEARRQEYLETLRTESERLGHLVENVLAYARLERGNRGMQIERHDVSSLLDRVRERLDLRVEKARMRLRLELPERDGPIEVRADAAAFEQILFNLVDNACKYATSASDRTVHLAVTRSDRRVRITVRDHGPGIDRGDARALFRPFCKGRRERERHSAGVGLGLTLSRVLARSMGGDLRIDERVRDGAAFILELPADG
jgi:signal transduction histidine kinase